MCKSWQSSRIALCNCLSCVPGNFLTYAWGCLMSDLRTFRQRLLKPRVQKPLLELVLGLGVAGVLPSPLWPEIFEVMPFC